VSIGQKGTIHLVPATCDLITCTSKSTLEHRSEWNDTLISCQM